MSSKTFDVRLLVHYCKGCGLCVDCCPQGKLYLEKVPNKKGIHQVAVHGEPDCTGCLKCATICPDAAIEIFRCGRQATEAAARREP